MGSQTLSLKLLPGEEVETPQGWTIKVTYGSGSDAGYGAVSRSGPFGVNDSYFNRVCALFLIICLVCCSYYFAYVWRRPVRRLVEKAEPAPEDPAKVAEAKMNAALAARSRQEAFDKSGAEEEAKKIAAERAARKAAEFTKPWPRHRGKGDNPLQWQAGSATRRGFT